MSWCQALSQTGHRKVVSPQPLWPLHLVPIPTLSPEPLAPSPQVPGPITSTITITIDDYDCDET